MYSPAPARLCPGGLWSPTLVHLLHLYAVDSMIMLVIAVLCSPAAQGEHVCHVPHFFVQSL